MRNQTEARRYCSHLGIDQRFRAAHPRGVPPIKRGSSETGPNWEGCLPRRIKSLLSQKMKLNQLELRSWSRHWWSLSFSPSSCTISVQTGPTSNCHRLCLSRCYNLLCQHAGQARAVANGCLLSSFPRKWFTADKDPSSLTSGRETPKHVLFNRIRLQLPAF